MEKDIIKNPIVTFIDTSILDPMYNTLSDEHYKILKKYVDNNSILLITSSVVLKEIKVHFKEKIEEAYEKLNNILTSRSFSLLKESKKYKNLFIQDSSSNMIRESYRLFNKKLLDLKFKILTDTRISVSKLLEMYFGNKPPFCKKNKKSEFPDAIMYLMLKKEVNDNYKIHIIAQDDDWERLVATNHNFIIHKSIRDYLDFILQDEKLYNDTRVFLNSKNAKDKIISLFKDQLDKKEFRVCGTNIEDGILYGYDYDYYEKISIYNYDFIIDSIEDIYTKNKEYYVQAVILCSAYIDMRCEYFDEEDSIWDPEDKEYIDKNYKEFIETHELTMPVRILIKCVNNDFIIESFNSIYTDDDFNKLDNQTLISRKFSSTINPNKFTVIRNLKCPSCNNNINIDLISDDTECVSSVERNMGIENEYKIDIHKTCKNCGNNYHITGKVWEYPVNSFNYEEDVKIKNEE